MAQNDQPLAERMRPQTLEDYRSQNHLVGPQGTLTKVLAVGRIPSLILWGPPGTGKTTLANILAKASGRTFYSLSAINAGVKDVREVIKKAEGNLGLFNPKQRPLLFIDEIHRFSKSQQDALLGAVEKGVVTLIGATTENPSFEVIPALLSRCQVYILEALDKDDLVALLHNALERDSLMAKKKVTLKEVDALLRFSGGDARKLLNAFELICLSEEEEEVVVTNELVLSKVQQNMTRYDKTGEQHYDISSALIKSIRGSDPNAAIYWLARMIEGGEDVKFIARRLIIAASEDIGHANPTALVMATNTFQAVSAVGFPESRIILGQCVTYLASSPKSNAAYMAINKAQRLVRQTGDLPVPLHLRNAPSKLMKQLDYGKDYLYSHDYPGNFVHQEYMPDAVTNTKLYDPGKNQREQAHRNYLKHYWKDKYNY
ncbi:MAG: replication-associated recombination protein A [Aureispira sp.]